MNPNYVRKRKEHAVIGPYETNTGPTTRPSVIVPMLSQTQENCLQVLSHPWRCTVLTPIEWMDIKQTNDVWEYLACIKGRIINQFAMKIDTFVRISKSVRMELIAATSNELAILMMACLYNRKLQIIQVDEAEIDDSVIFGDFGFDADLTHKLFYFFNRQSHVLNGRDDISLYAILAGIVLFSPDKSIHKTELIQSYQDELFDLLHAYVERYRACDKSLIRELMRLLMSLKELSASLKDIGTRRVIELLSSSLSGGNNNNKDNHNGGEHKDQAQLIVKMEPIESMQ